MNDFVRQGHEGVTFFVGPEIEQTPAFGKKTLFVVGLQETALVEKLAREHKAPHIFLSANRSFDGLSLVGDKYVVQGSVVTNATDWESQITELLDKGFMVSLDYPAHKHDMVLKVLNAGIWQSRNFVPILSVAIPHVSTSSKNLTVKIDDINFRATNPGVWCMHHSEVTDSNRFTDWNEYTGDQILSTDVVVPATPVAPTPAVTAPPAAPANETTPIGTGAAETVPTDEPKNETDIGLDSDSPSKLKPDENETATVETVVTSAEAIAAYAEGAKTDPLSQEASKKPAKAKKA